MKCLARLVPVSCLALGACETDPAQERCEPGPGIICTYVGTDVAGLGEEDAPADETPLYLPQDTAWSATGTVIIIDWNDHRIREVDADGRVNTVIGTGQLGDAQDGVALEMSLNHPTNVTVAPNDHWIVSAWHNSKVLDYDPESGEIVTICGNGMRSFAGDGGPAIDAILDLPAATAFGDDGSMYIVDQANQRVRQVGTDGNINTVIGTGEPGFSGDGGPAIDAQISLPKGQSAAPSGRIEVRDGEIYLVDSGNHRVRKVDADGVITTFAGDGMAGMGGDGGPADEASLNRPTDIAFDSDGAMYIADTDNSCVRRVLTDGTIETFAGVCGEPSEEVGGEGDGGPAAEARLNRPYGVMVDDDDNLYIADTHNHRIAVVWAE